ncbi:hypothetical protein ACHAWO_012891 [Cyclotella atomus]|uniref:Uncharacterized protein n=1 Tax=Cyclotella atomus TaxID=382360 RepID=A0ABD3QWX7_9STRA
MPQFYNGATRPIVDSLTGAVVGSVSAAAIYEDLANDLFSGDPPKVVFGFCISNCGGTGSNALVAADAVGVLVDLKLYTPTDGSPGNFVCNGGAFFWKASGMPCRIH